MTVASIFDNWRKLLGNVDDLLKDKVYQKEFLAHLKKSVEGTTKGDFPSNGDVLAIVKKLGETMTYHNLPVMFRHEDHAEVRKAIAKAIEYNLEHPASPQWSRANIKYAQDILDEFGVRSEKSEPVQKTVRKGILRSAHTEMVMEEHELSSADRLKMFKEGKF